MLCQKFFFCSDLSWGLFLESPENFLGGHTSLCIFAMPRFKVIKLRNPLGFYWIKNMMKDQLFKTSRLQFDNWLLGPETVSEFRETGPWEQRNNCLNLPDNRSNPKQSGLRSR